MKDSSFFRAPNGILVEEGHVEIEDCVLFDSSAYISKHSEFKVANSRFFNFHVIARNQSQVVIERCRFEADESEKSEYVFNDVFTALQGIDGAKIVCRNSFFQGYFRIFEVQNTDTSITLKSCVLDGEVFGEASENANVSVHDCFIGAPLGLLYISTNVHGKLEFERNKLKSHTVPGFAIDKISNLPRHDFEDDRYVLYEKPTAVPSGKRKSKFTKAVKKKAQEQGKKFAEPYKKMGLFKQCMRCRRFEDEDAMLRWRHGVFDREAKENFRYCGGCKSATYCSDECRDAHWPDHRLTCSGREKSS